MKLKQAINIGLVQITEPISHHVNLPYSLGLLQSYVEAHAEENQYHFLDPVFLREPLEPLVERLGTADLVGFSTYVWNMQYSLALAQALKQRWPELVIVFGGPQVPDQAESFLRTHDFIDLCCHGEGERTFLGLLGAYARGESWSELAGVSWLEAGVFETRAKAPRLKELDQLPSPYLSGYFEPLLARHPEFNWTIPWETNRGCPFSCTFCDWGSAVQSKLYRFDMKRLRQEIQWMASHQIEVVYCCDSNFGILPRDLEIAQELAVSKKSSGYPSKIYTQMTKNQSERAFQAQQILFDAGLHLSSTLSLQSVSEQTLTAIRRDNISLDVYRELLQRFVEAGIPAYTDFLIGLPGETFESFVAGIDTLLNQGQHQEIRFWNVYLLPNAEMSAPTYRERYGIQTLMQHYVSPISPVQVPIAGVHEQLEIVIETDTMPRADWARMRALAWLTQIVYYGKLLQPALLLVQALSGLSHQQILLRLMQPSAETPLLSQLFAFLSQRAQEMLAGQSEFVAGPDLRTGVMIWYPTQSFVLTQLLHAPYLGEIYLEAQTLLVGLLLEHDLSLPEGLLEEALWLSLALFRTYDSRHQDFQLQQRYNLWELYQGILKGQQLRLRSGQWRLIRRPDSQGRWQVQTQEVMGV